MRLTSFVLLLSACAVPASAFASHSRRQATPAAFQLTMSSNDSLSNVSGEDAPAPQKGLDPSAFVRRPVMMDPSNPTEETKEGNVDTTMTKTKVTEKFGPIDNSSALVPVNEETVEFTAGLLGFSVGLALFPANPIFTFTLAALTNYLSKTDEEAGEIVTNVSTRTIEAYNYVVKLDAKYAVLKRAQYYIEKALTSAVQSNKDWDPDAIQKTKEKLKDVSERIKAINDRYDILETGGTALGVIGDIVEKGLSKASEINNEYGVGERVKKSVDNVVEKAKKEK